MVQKIILILMSFLLVISITFAETKPDLGPLIEICSGSIGTCHTTSFEQIPYDKNIYFRITLINDGSLGWICFNHLRYSLSYTHEKQEAEFIGTRDIYNPKSEDNALNYCIPPNEKFYFYVPFEAYNSIKEDLRIREWSIIPKVSLDDVKCYKDSTFKAQNNCVDRLQSGVSMEGNRIKFESIKESPTTRPQFDIWKKRLTSWWAILIYIAGGLVTLITLYNLILGGRRR